ncbi:PLDc N-terminal domain-containing protein [Microbacterium sp.]|uniref:PLDc N-terminal domain-containing protein n=1 Tax=Microbacterium sp. TaxID=51671 RepID=UPI003F713230
MPLLSLLVIGVMVFSLVDIIRRDDFQVKHLPKTFWIIIVILLPLIGSVLWFTLGRVYPEDGPRMPRPPRTATTAPAPAPTYARDTRSTEQQLADLEREIEEDRLRDELRRRQRENPSS